MAGKGRWTTASMGFVPILIILCCSWIQVSHGKTELERHVGFFDKNKDGILTLSESIEGFVAIGFPLSFATLAASTTHSIFGPLTSFFPTTNILIKNIAIGVHGSDSGAYNKDGTFNPQKFEEIFKHAKTRPDAFTQSEVWELVIANQDLRIESWLPAFFEWDLITRIAKDEEGFMHRDMVRGIFDGSTFERLANRTRSSSE